MYLKDLRFGNIVLHFNNLGEKGLYYRYSEVIDLFWEGRHTEQEMIDFIRNHDFLKRQFQLD